MFFSFEAPYLHIDDIEFFFTRQSNIFKAFSAHCASSPEIVLNEEAKSAIHYSTAETKASLIAVLVH